MLGLGAPLVSFSLISSAPLTAALRLRAGHSQAAALAEEFQQNGAVVLRGFLSPSLLEKCRKVYDDALNQPVRRGAQVKYPDGTLYNPAIGHRTDDEAVLDMVNEVPFASTLAELWGSESVWFFDHELWWKRHGDSDNGRSAEQSDTPFHQDSLAVPFRGLHVGLFWICFQPIPKENCLQVVKGSHRGPVYQLAPGTIFGMDPDEPMVPESVQPVMPMTEDERAHWEYCAWDLEPGDVVVVHPGTIHGSAPVSASCPERHTRWCFGLSATTAGSARVRCTFARRARSSKRHSCLLFTTTRASTFTTKSCDQVTTSRASSPHSRSCSGLE